MSLRVIWQYMDKASVHIIFFGDGPVHILPYDPQCHALFAIYVISLKTIVFFMLVISCYLCFAWYACYINFICYAC